MTDTFIPPALLDAVAARGWTFCSADEHPPSVSHTFEDEACCLHLTIFRRRNTEETWAYVTSSFFRPKSRKRYAAEPIVHDRMRDAAAYARQLSAELRFLKSFGVDTITARLHHKASGVHARNGKRHVLKSDFSISEILRLEEKV